MVWMDKVVNCNYGKGWKIILLAWCYGKCQWWSKEVMGCQWWLWGVQCWSRVGGKVVSRNYEDDRRVSWVASLVLW